MKPQVDPVVAAAAKATRWAPGAQYGVPTPGSWVAYTQEGKAKRAYGVALPVEGGGFQVGAWGKPPARTVGSWAAAVATIPGYHPTVVAAVERAAGRVGGMQRAAGEAGVAWTPAMGPVPTNLWAAQVEAQRALRAPKRATTPPPTAPVVEPEAPALWVSGVKATLALAPVKSGPAGRREALRLTGYRDGALLGG